MRGLWRSIAGLIVLLALLAAGLALFRGPIAAHFIRSAMAGAGIEDPAVSVKKLTLSEIELTGISGGGGALLLNEIVAGFDLGALLADGRVRRIRVGEGAATLVMDEAGRIALAGMPIPPKGGGGPLPFDALAVDGLALALESPAGAATGRLSGAFSPEAGGAFDIGVEADAIGARGITLRRATLAGALELAADGSLTFDGTAQGDVETPWATARSAALALDGGAASWREALAGRAGALAGEARVTLQSAEVSVAESPALAALARADAVGGPIASLAASGSLGLAFGSAGLRLDASHKAPLRVVADRGDVLTISGSGGRPLYASAAGVEQVAGAAQVSGGMIAGVAQVEAERAGEGPWRFSASADLGEQTIGKLMLGPTSLSATGEATASAVRAAASLSAAIVRAEVDRFRVADAPIRAALDIAADLEQRTLTISAGSSNCLHLDRARMTIAGEDAEARLADASFCAGAAALLDASWNETGTSRLGGRLEARSALYRFGQTRFEGAPPAIDFTLASRPAEKIMTVDGSLGGGRILINETMLLSGTSGGFALRFDETGLKGEARIDAARLAQDGEAPQVAPVLTSGSATLADGRLSFAYAATTPEGASLGDGEGSHHLTSGRGETAFDFGRLEFRPGGLQPAALAPGLTGIIGSTVGAASGAVRFAWGQGEGDAGSSGEFELFDLTFRGPGLAVSETRGVSGRLVLSSLAPLKSAGPQTLSIRRIDLNALLLDNGVIDFELPGDETLRVIDAEFPWFGGRIGIYEASAALSGERASVPLRVESVDLAQILDYVEVEGLSGEGVLSGALPLVFEDSKGRIVDGELSSVGPGAIRYVGPAADAAATAGADANVAFSILKDLQFNSLKVSINGPLDGRIAFNSVFEGTGEVPVSAPIGKAVGRVPVLYRINLDAALLELLNQANLSRRFDLQIQQALEQPED